MNIASDTPTWVESRTHRFGDARLIILHCWPPVGSITQFQTSALTYLWLMLRIKANCGLNLISVCAFGNNLVFHESQRGKCSLALLVASLVHLPRRDIDVSSSCP